MNLDFLMLGGDGAVARSPMEHVTRRAGARFETRNGWSVAVGYGAPAEDEAAAAGRAVGWADVSHLGKLELQGPPQELDRIAADCGAELRLGEAVGHDRAWWCRLTQTRALVLADPAAMADLRGRVTEAAAGSERAAVLDVTSNFAAMALAGPLAREVFARFCALDLRPAVTPVGALRPGSIGRQPGILICEAEDRYLFLFGAATAEYMWSVVADAGGHLGGRPIGVDALPALQTQEALRA